MAEAKPPQAIIVIVDGVRFELDYTDASASLFEEITRHVKGILKKLEERARECAKR